MIFQIPQDDEQVAVYFRLPASIWADRVHLVGDFNGWSTSATPMRAGELYWEARVVLRAGERYAYAYLLDGVDWCTDMPMIERAINGPPLVTMLPVDIPQMRRRLAAQ
jgi:1,4-alpha-glucan branching enzyme